MDNKWENTFEIDGMKFTVKCTYDKLETGFRYTFIAYDTNNVPVATAAVKLDREPTVEEFEKEIAEPSIKKLQVFVVNKYLSSEFMTLVAPKIHKLAEDKDQELTTSLKKKWQTFVADNIRKAANHGQFEVNILHNLTMAGDNVFEGGYNKVMMLVDTPKMLEARGFKVKVFEHTNGSDPTAFTMIISW